MKRGRFFTHALLWLVVVVMALPPEVFAQDTGGAPSQEFSKEQLEQILAPIALYPDEVIAQILMASTYPIEIVQADRWLAQNKNLKGDDLANALEKQTWDPSVKSLANFPQVLSMMSEKLDWTQKLGDAVLGQQKQVMETIQVLRRKAKDAGNLNTTPEQKVVVEQETIIIQPTNPEVVYVPTYNPTVVYGAWPYPAYPPYSYYPPGYVPGAALFSFGVGLAIGAAWGYAWGGCNWGGGDINIDSNRNRNVNRNNNRERVQQRDRQGGRGNWNHDASHRKGAAYRDSKTARQFGQSSRPGASTRDARGFGEGRGGGAQTRDFGRGTAGTAGRGGSFERGGRQNAFNGAGNGGFERSASQRGQSSRFGGGSRGGGGFSGGSRGGGGARGGGGGGRGGGGGGRR